MRFHTIQRLKATRVLMSGRINIASVIAAKLYSSDAISLLSYIVLTIFYNAEFEVESTGGKKLLLSRNFLSVNREDYWDIYINFISLGEFDELIFRRRFSFVNVLKNITCFLSVIRNNVNLGLKFFDLLTVSSLQAYYIRAKKNYNSIQFSNYESYISFCDSYLEENLVAQMAKCSGLKTATLQHGQYRVNMRGRESTDCEAYLNFVSDYIFVWGEATKIEFIKGGVESDRILVCGALKSFYEEDRVSYIVEDDAICIILNGDSHLKSNFTMLPLVAKFCEDRNISFYIRPHPASKNKFYEKFLKNPLCLGLHNDSRRYQFSIIHTSGVFVEMLMNDDCFLVYKDDFLDELFEIDGSNFCSVDELSFLYDNGVATMQAENLKSFFNVACNKADLIGRYRSAINEFLL